MGVVEQTVKLSELTEHPDNPRKISDKALEDLQASLKDFPGMLEARPIVVNQDMQIIGGSQRHKALIANGETETSVKVVDWNAEKQREFMLKDNTEKGQWDYNELLNKWDTADLNNWGVPIQTWNPVLDPNQEQTPYTDEQIDRVKEKLESQFNEVGTEKKYVTIECKNCHREYYAD